MHRTFDRVRFVVSLIVCLSVRPSVPHTPVLYQNDWTDRAGFGMNAFFHLCYNMLGEKSDISVDNGSSLWNFVPNCGLRKFRHGTRSRCQQNSSSVELVDCTCDGRRAADSRRYTLTAHTVYVLHVRRP